MQDKNSLSHVGNNIRAIRRRRHMSQVELAEKLGMRPGPVNCIERGKNLPSARVLKKLSEILAVPIDAFFAEFARADSSLRVCETGAKYITKSEEETDSNIPCARPARTSIELATLPGSLFLTVNQLADAFLALEDICHARKSAEIPLGIPFDQTDDGIQKLCERVRQLLGISDAVIFDYLELLENAGLRVVFCKMPDGEESISCHDEINGNAFIFVSTGSGMTVERQLFRLSYELGRLYVHAPGRERRGAVIHTGHDARGKEFNAHRSARRFAALFLMPAAALNTTVAQLGIGPSGWTLELLYRIKHRYGVSAEALLYRLSELRLIESASAADIKRKILAWYAAHNNSEPDSTRRILSPNGRLGDLLHVALKRCGKDEEVKQLHKQLIKYSLPGLQDSRPAQTVAHNRGTKYPEGRE